MLELRFVATDVGSGGACSVDLSEKGVPHVFASLVHFIITINKNIATSG